MLGTVIRYFFAYLDLIVHLSGRYFNLYLPSKKKTKVWISNLIDHPIKGASELNLSWKAGLARTPPVSPRDMVDRHMHMVGRGGEWVSLGMPREGEMRAMDSLGCISRVIRYLP